MMRSAGLTIEPWLDGKLWQRIRRYAAFKHRLEQGLPDAIGCTAAVTGRFFA